MAFKMGSPSRFLLTVLFMAAGILTSSSNIQAEGASSSAFDITPTEFTKCVEKAIDELDSCNTLAKRAHNVGKSHCSAVAGGDTSKYNTCMELYDDLLDEHTLDCIADYDDAVDACREKKKEKEKETDSTHLSVTLG